MPLPLQTPESSSPGGLRVLTLTGAPSGLRYPDICARCGAGARERITIERVFQRAHRDSPYTYPIYAADVPFCPVCASQHAREVRRISFLSRFLICFRAGVMIAAVGAAGIAALLGRDAAMRLLRGDTSTGNLVLGGIALAFVLLALLNGRAAWNETRRFAIPGPTSVTSAFEFSDDLSDSFEPERHTYTLTNAAFAAALDSLNRDRTWDPTGPRAKRADRARWMTLAAIIIFAIVMQFWDSIRHVFGW